MRGATVFFWEQWRQTYKALAIVALTMAFYALLAWHFKDLLFYMFAKNEVLVIGTAYIPVLGAAVLLFIQESRGRIGFEYPRRMLVLPAHTFTLVATPLLYRLIVVGLFALTASWICDAFLRDLFFKGPEVLLLMTLVAAAQALVFLNCGYGASTGTAIFLAAFVISAPGLRVLLNNIAMNVSLASPITPDTVVPDIGYGGVPIATALLFYWFCVAYQGARHARSEVAEDPVGGLVRVATRLTYFDRDRAEFPSPGAAQQWLEWRRGAYLFPWMSLALAIVLVLTFRVAMTQLENRFVLVLNMLAIAPAIVASLAGYTVTRTGQDYQWFVGARPLTTSMIARARLRAGVRAVLWGYVLLGIAFVITFKVMFPHDPIIASVVQDLRLVTSTDGSFGEGLMLLAAVSAATVLGVWALFWLARASGALVWLAGAVVGIWYYTAGGLYVIDTSTGAFTTPTTVFLWAMSALIGVAGCAALIAAVYRRYVGVAAFVGIAIAWAALVAASVWVNNLVQFGGPLLAASWLLLPAVPLASIPLTLEWQRHR